MPATSAFMPAHVTPKKFQSLSLPVLRAVDPPAPPPLAAVSPLFAAERDDRLSASCSCTWDSTCHPPLFATFGAAVASRNQSRMCGGSDGEAFHTKENQHGYSSIQYKK